MVVYAEANEVVGMTGVDGLFVCVHIDHYKHWPYWCGVLSLHLLTS